MAYYCVVNLGTSYDCVAFQGASSSTGNLNCWGGAKKACDDIGMSLPDRGTLELIYNNKSKYADLPQSGNFWSSSEYKANKYDTAGDAYKINFGNGIRSNSYKGYRYGALCVGN